MARNSRRMALYEVIGKTELKSAQNKELDRLGSSEPRTKPLIDSMLRRTDTSSVSDVKPWPNRPKWLRFYNNRIEFSLSWTVAIIAILTIFAIFLVFFRLGRITAGANAEKISEIAPKVIAKPRAKAPVVDRAEAGPFGRPPVPKMIVPMGENVIVIASYNIASHLAPVKSYFAGFGVETEIINQAGRYLLVTQQRYNNPEKSGTDGYKAKQKIIEIGAGYKSPKGSGFASFASKLFSDAYGMKVKGKQE